MFRFWHSIFGEVVAERVKESSKLGIPGKQVCRNSLRERIRHDGYAPVGSANGIDRRRVQDGIQAK